MKSGFLVLSVLGVFVFGAAGVAQNNNAKEKQRRALAEEMRSYEKWITDDVGDIITDEERTAWKRLSTAEERDQFIEQFWVRRDPTPDTSENEYKEEHYRRIAYANEHFASGIPGWKTDRGRIYIMHGPPDEIESHPSGGSYERPPEEGGGHTTVYPFEKWRYRYVEGTGQDVVIEFVDRTMTGEYRLTSDPSEKDALLYVPNAGLTLLEQMGRASKTDRFSRTDGTHLGTSLGGTPASMNPFDWMALLVNMQRPPVVKFKDLESVVNTKVTYNLLPFEIRTDFIKITSDTVLAALTVQLSNKDLSFQQKDGVEHGVVNIFGRVSTMTRRVAQTFEDVVTVDLPAGLLQQSLDHKSVYWQALPLRPGLYRLNVVVKDVQSGNMGTVEKPIRIPSFDDETLSASSLILTDRIEKVSTKDIGKGQFVVGATKLRPSVSERFRKSDNMGIYLQVYNLGMDEKKQPSATIEYAVLKDNNPEPVFKVTENVRAASAQQLTLEKQLPLQSLGPGKYTLNVKVIDHIANKTISPAASFTVQ